MPPGQPSIKEKLAAAAARPFKQPGAPVVAPDQAAAEGNPSQAMASAEPDQASKAILLPTGQPVPDHIKVRLHPSHLSRMSTLQQLSRQLFDGPLHCMKHRRSHPMHVLHMYVQHTSNLPAVS